MATPPDDLEQEIDLALENIELKRREQALTQENQQLKGRVTQLEQQLQPFQKKKENKRKIISGIKEKLLYAIGISIVVAGIGIKYCGGNIFKPPERVGNVTEGSSIDYDYHTTPTLEYLLQTAFVFPVEIQVQNIRRGAVGEGQRRDVFVYDAGDYTLHRFASEEPTHTTAEYSAPNIRKTMDYTLGSGRTSFMFFDSSNNQLTGEGIPIIVKVDNYDGTLTTFSIPELEFVKREEGSLPYITKNKFMEKTEQTINYILFNDAPSRFQGNFNLVLGLLGWSAKLHGLCGYGPALAFNNQEQTIMGGNICENGDLEKQITIPYKEAGISKTTVENIIDTELYYNVLLLVERYQGKIKHIKLNF